MAMDPAKLRQLRSVGVVFLIIGLVFLAVGAVARQTVFLTMGPSMIGMGIAFIASGRRRTP